MRKFVLFGLIGIGILIAGCSAAAMPPVFAPVDVAPLEPETIPSAAQPEAEPTTSVPSPTATEEPMPEPTESPMSEATPTPAPVELPGTELFTFVAGESGWYSVDDNVMGGVSASTVSFVEPNVMVFTGVMSLENNGGFSSVRSDWRVMDLGGADGVLMRVLGDGKTYRLRIRTVDTGNNISYNALFETTPETWRLVYIPFADMVPTYFGRVVDVGPLNSAQIGSFGFMLSDKQPGEFGLAVDWMRAVTEEELRTFVE